MEITTKRYKNCDLVKAVGRIDSNTAPALAEVMEKINSDGVFKIVFDMEEVDFMSSAGLRILTTTQKECKKFNRGELALAQISKRIYDALDLAGLTSLFAIYDDVKDAIGNI